jgi:hypothetical protein
MLCAKKHPWASGHIGWIMIIIYSNNDDGGGGDDHHQHHQQQQHQISTNAVSWCTNTFTKKRLVAICSKCRGLHPVSADGRQVPGATFKIVFLLIVMIIILFLYIVIIVICIYIYTILVIIKKQTSYPPSPNFEQDDTSTIRPATSGYGRIPEQHTEDPGHERHPQGVSHAEAI